MSLRLPRLTKADAIAMKDRADRRAHIAELAVRCLVLDQVELTEQAESDDWSYTLYAYRLTAPHGGIVVLRAHCKTNVQTDSVSAQYLDDIGDTYQYEPLSYSIARIKVARQRLIDRELAESA